MNRNTKQRQIIYDVVISHKDHPDVETIFNEVHKIDPNISLGTVYRNLNVLDELGLIKHIQVPGPDRFDFRLDEHDHILCQICGNVFDSPIKHKSSDDQEVATKSGFKILKHRTVYEGICPDCLKKFNNK